MSPAKITKKLSTARVKTIPGNANECVKNKEIKSPANKNKKRKRVDAKGSLDADQKVSAVTKSKKRKIVKANSSLNADQKVSAANKKVDANGSLDADEKTSAATNNKNHKSADADDFNDVEEIVPIVAKKKRKRKTKTQELAENKTVVDPKDEFAHALNAFIKQRLSGLEKQEFELTSSGVHVMQLPQKNILECFEEKLPKCLQVLKKNVKHPGCPLALVLVGSAIRSVDLKRSLQILSEKVPIAKLFAKHMKIKDQVTYLEKNVIKLAVGTPKRISELLDLDALDLRSLRYIMLDWHWRDSKLRRMMDMQEVKREVFELFYKHLGKKVMDDKVRVVLL